MGGALRDVTEVTQSINDIGTKQKCQIDAQLLDARTLQGLVLLFISSQISKTVGEASAKNAGEMDGN